MEPPAFNAAMDSSAKIINALLAVLLVKNVRGAQMMELAKNALMEVSLTEQHARPALIIALLVHLLRPVIHA